MDPEFSVVIPTYGRPAFLAEAIASVTAQTGSTFECLVVDDATPEALTLPTADTRFRLIRRPDNGGPAAARNTGVHAATGRYVAFLDDDDVWAADRLERAARAHGSAPVVVCGQGTLGEAVVGSGRVVNGDVRDTILDGITPHLGATSVERSHALSFDERYRGSEDVEWWLRVAQRCAVARVPEVGLFYRRHDTARAGTSPQARMAGAQLLLDDNAVWFDAHPHAKAFRMKRMGLLAMQAGDRSRARRCFTIAMRLHPQARTAWHAVRTLAPSATSSR